MGAWGAKTFENDDARDWVYELEDSTTLEPIKDAILAITENDDYVEADECSAALAAAEVLAALKERPAPDLPEEVIAWVQAYKKKIPANLTSLALKAITRIKTDSELKELWEEAGAKEWYDAVHDLEARLRQ
jgi:hypothetical protein